MLTARHPPQPSMGQCTLPLYGFPESHRTGSAEVLESLTENSSLMGLWQEETGVFRAGRLVARPKTIRTVQDPNVRYDRKGHCATWDEVRRLHGWLETHARPDHLLWFELQVQTGARGCELSDNRTNRGLSIESVRHDRVEGRDVYYVEWKPGKRQRGKPRVAQVHPRTARLYRYCYEHNYLQADGSFSFSQDDWRGYFNKEYRPVLGGSFLDKLQDSVNAAGHHSYAFSANKSTRSFYATVTLLCHVNRLRRLGIADCWRQAISATRRDLRHHAEHITEDHYLNMWELLYPGFVGSFSDCKRPLEVFSWLLFGEEYDGVVL